MVEILGILKRETQPWHDQVELLVPVFTNGFTLSDYQRLLTVFYGYYRGFEKLIAHTPGLDDVLPDWRLRSKLPWLEKDLLWLGSTKSDLARVAVCSALPRIATPAGALGALYVTEGSTLGGQIICRHLVHSLGLQPGMGATFFGSYGMDSGAMWKTLTRVLGALDQVDHPEIVNAAVDTFQSLCLWLSEAEQSELALERIA